MSIYKVSTSPAAEPMSEHRTIKGARYGKSLVQNFKNKKYHIYKWSDTLGMWQLVT